MTTPAFADQKGGRAKPDLSKERDREEELGIVKEEEDTSLNGDTSQIREDGEEVEFDSDRRDYWVWGEGDITLLDKEEQEQMGRGRDRQAQEFSKDLPEEDEEEEEEEEEFTARVVGPLRRVVIVKHGEHEGQEGRKGKAGGSAPGFKHTGAESDGDEGGGSVKDHSEGPDSFDNIAGEFATTTLDRDNPDVLVKLLKFTPEVDEEGNVDLEAVGTWEVEVMTGPRAKGSVEEVSDYDLDPAPMGTADVWTTDESPSATLERAVGIFGITDFMSEAGFILPDGGLLDFSGGPGGEGMRGMDHRSISQALLDDQGGEKAEEYSGGLIYFMDHTGAVRVSYTGGRGSGVSLSVDVSRQPTSAQWSTIREWAGAVDDINIDISDPGSGSVLWSNDNPSDIGGSLRELREQAEEQLDAGRILRMIFRHGEHESEEETEDAESKPE